MLAHLEELLVKAEEKKKLIDAKESDRRANQLNPDHELYYRSRGYEIHYHDDGTFYE